MERRDLLQDAGPVHFGLICAVQHARMDDTVLPGPCVPGLFKARFKAHNSSHCAVVCLFISQVRNGKACGKRMGVDMRHRVNTLPTDGTESQAP